LKQLEEQYDRTQFVHVDWHIAGQLDQGSDADALWNYYGLNAAPAVLFDGYNLQVGGGQDMYPTYAPIVANHLSNDLAKLTVTANIVIGSGTGSVHGEVTVAPGETITSPSECRIRCVVYENDIVLCCDPRGNDDWSGIARDGLTDVVLTATNPGDVQTYDQNFTINGNWNSNNLHAIVYVQRLTNKRILNAGYANALYSLNLDTLDPVTQKLQGSPAPIEWDEELTYTGATSSDVQVSINESTLPAGWDAELVYNSTTYPSTFTIPAMTTNQQATFVVRTIPGTNAGLGTVTLSAAAVSQPSASKSVDLNAIWNIPAILLVDDDNGAATEVGYKNAISAAGYSAVTHSVLTQNVPTTATLNIFDAVIWTTGDLETQTIDFDTETSIRAYLDQGGNLFLSSQGFMDERGFNTLSINYLKVASFTLDQGATSATGLAGDVIGDGLAFPLAPPFPNLTDRINPNTGAFGWLKNQLNNPVALRYDSGVYKTVFMAAPFEGIPLLATAADPNNQKTVMKRILDWFIPTSTDVTPGTGTATTKISLAQNAPNPFSAKTSLSFVLPKAGPVSLSVYDVSGRLVSTLIDRPMDSGTHQVNWDGRDSGGNSVANGVYLLRLQAGGETLTRDMVRMK